MANQINVYKNNPTAGATDGTLVSSDGSYTSPINFTLKKSQSQKLKLAIRTESGFKTTDETKIKSTGSKISLCWTEEGTFLSEISTIEPITDTNKIFYACVAASDIEELGKYISENIQVIHKITES